MKFSKWILAIGLVLGLSVSSFSSMLLFNGNVYFNQMSQLNLSNEVVSTNGDNQLYWKTSSLTIDLYPTYKDKGLLATMKIQIDPYNTSANNYLIAKGFSMIYNSDKFDYALFIDRYGFRFKDPMMTGMDQYENAYVNKYYDLPQVFSYNGKTRLPAFYALSKDEQKFNAMAYLKAGKGLSGLYLSMDDALGYELAAFVNKNNNSYHVIGDATFKMDALKAGALVRYQALDSSATATAISNATVTRAQKGLFYNGLMTQYNDFATALSLGAFVNFNLEGLFGAFAEAKVQLPKGTAGKGNVNATNNNIMLEVYAGAGTPLAFGDTEVSFLYRMQTNHSRMEVSLKDYNAIDLEVAKLFLLGSFSYMNDSLYSGYNNSGILGTLSMRVSVLDDFLSLHVAGDFAQQDLIDHKYSEVLFKAALAQNDVLITGLNFYEGVAGLAILDYYQKSTQQYEFYGTSSTNQATYILPVAGVSYTLVDNFVVSLTYGYDIFGFGYDNDGKTHESEMGNTTIGTTTYKYVQSWYQTFVNPTINLNASVKF